MIRSARCTVLLPLALLALICALLSGCSSRLVSEATVSRVTDGGTVRITPEIDGEDRVRLIGVNTPEMEPERGPEPYGEDAARFTQRYFEGQTVSLEFDVEREDDYGRLLAYVYLSDGSMFNKTLLWEGYAQVASFPPNTRYLDRLEAAQEEAREARRGIWSLSEDELCRLRDRGNGIGGQCG